MKRIVAAFMMFTRIPVWRLYSLSSKDCGGAIVFWPLAGWITGGVTAIAIYFLSMIVYPWVAVALALSLRAWLTSGLHEDGLADFFDGFGGGRDKDSILAIMKDSHIGTYGALALILYYLTVVGLLTLLPPIVAAMAVFAADPFCKFCGAQIVNFLPYARAEGAKNKVKYQMMTPIDIAITIVTGILPMLPLCFLCPIYADSVLAPFIIFAILVAFMKRKIGGYTGDCCGATFLLCELSMFFAIVVIYSCLVSTI